jgi:hypothetical protein
MLLACCCILYAVKNTVGVSGHPVAAVCLSVLIYLLLLPLPIKFGCCNIGCLASHMQNNMVDFEVYGQFSTDLGQAVLLVQSERTFRNWKWSCCVYESLDAGGAEERQVGYSYANCWSLRRLRLDNTRVDWWWSEHLFLSSAWDCAVGVQKKNCVSTAILSGFRITASRFQFIVESPRQSEFHVVNAWCFRGFSDEWDWNHKYPLIVAFNCKPYVDILISLSQQEERKWR